MVLNMLTTISMIKVGKTYGNLMVDVQTGSEKLKDRARRILGIVTGLDYDAADALLRQAKWNVKAAIVMQKAGLTLPQALKRLKKADDLVRDAIGEDIEPRLARASSEPASRVTPRLQRIQLACRGRVEDQVGVGVQLQEGRRQLRRQRSIDHSRHAARLALAVCEQFHLARLKNRRHSHRQRLGRHPIDVPAEQRRIAAARFLPQLHAMGARVELAARFVESDVAVRADAEDLNVDTAGRGDGPFVAQALLVGVGGTDRKLMRSGWRFVCRKRCSSMNRRYEPGSPGCTPTNSSRLKVVTLDQSRARAAVSRTSSSVQRDRRASGGQPEHETGVLLECGGQTRRNRPGCGPGIREHRNSWTADR